MTLFRNNCTSGQHDVVIFLDRNFESSISSLMKKLQNESDEVFLKMIMAAFLSMCYLCVFRPHPFLFIKSRFT